MKALIYFTSIFIICVHFSCFSQTPESFYQKGVEFGRSGLYDKAIEFFDKALELKGDYYEAWYLKGINNGLLDKYNDALHCFNKAIEFGKGKTTR